MRLASFLEHLFPVFGEAISLFHIDGREFPRKDDHVIFKLQEILVGQESLHEQIVSEDVGVIRRAIAISGEEFPFFFVKRRLNEHSAPEKGLAIGEDAFEILDGGEYLSWDDVAISVIGDDTTL